MVIKFKVTGVMAAIAKLRYITDKVPENGRKAMHAAADRIVKDAKINVPEDTEELMKSIRKETSYDSGRHGRLNIQVVYGGTPDIDRYGVIVHENYEGIVEPSEYGKGPSDKTLAKRARYPDRYIGEKFLERAEEDNRTAVPKTILESIMSIIPKGSL